MKKPLGLALGALLFTSVLGAKDDKKAPPPSSLEGYLGQLAYYGVPIDADDDEPFLLPVTIDGIKMHVEVDTGAPVTTLDPRRVKATKTLEQVDPKLKARLAAKITDPKTLIVSTLTIGQARFANQPADPEILDSDWAQLRFGGVLGLDFFSRNFCIIDCGAREIFFRAAKPTAEQAHAIAESLKRSGFSPVPMYRGRHLLVDVSIVGKPITMLVDTGSRYSVIDEKERAARKIRPVNKDSSFLPTAVEGRMIGLNRIGLGSATLKLVELPDITLGDRQWQEVLAASVDISLGKEEDHETGIALGQPHGLIGADGLMIHGAGCSELNSCSKLSLR
jgi:predicted aspartyl protease